MSKVSKPSMPDWRPTVTAERSLLINDATQAVEFAIRNQGWVVIVCPDEKLADQAHRAVAGVIPKGSAGSGRTFILPNRSRVSVTQAAEPVFVPDGEPYTVMFLGWGQAQKDAFAGMNRWRLKATNVLSTGQKVSAA